MASRELVVSRGTACNGCFRLVTSACSPSVSYFCPVPWWLNQCWLRTRQYALKLAAYLELNYISCIEKQEKMKIRHSTEEIGATLLLNISYQDHQNSWENKVLSDTTQYELVPTAVWPVSGANSMILTIWTSIILPTVTHKCSCEYHYMFVNIIIIVIMNIIIVVVYLNHLHVTLIPTYFQGPWSHKWWSTVPSHWWIIQFYNMSI